jgi:hypothetical protein
MRTWTRTGSLALALLLAGVAAAAAQGVQLRLDVQPQAAQVGDRLEASVTFSGRGVGQPRLLGADAFEQRGVTSQNSVQFINGQLTVSRGYSFELIARREGRFTLTAEATGPGGTVRSNPAVVIVSGSRPAPPPAPPPTAAPPPAPDRRAGGKSQRFFIQALVKPTNPVVGRQVTVEYYLYLRDDVNAEKYELVGQPDFVGFTQRELTSSTRLTFMQDNVDGVSYQTALIKRFALFPTAAGDQTIGPLTLRIQYLRDDRRRSRDPFDMFPSLLRERDVAEVSSDPVVVDVQPLPAGGQPPDFAGDVGKYEIKAELDRAEAPLGEPFTLKLTVSGEGNLDTLRRPKLALDNDLRVYTDSERVEITPSVEKVLGKKVFETILISNASGEHEIPPIRLPYFDPDAREYRVATTAPLRIRITGDNAAGPAKQLNMVTRESVELRGRDLRYIRRDKPTVRLEQTALVAQPAFWAAFGVWPLLVAGLVLWRRRQGRLHADRRAYRSRRALKEARQRLRAAADLRAKGEPAQYYAELHRAVIGFIADKLDAAAPGLDRLALAQSLQEKGVRDEPLALLDALWREADGVRFGGLPSDEPGRKAALDRAHRLLAELGEELEG